MLVAATEAVEVTVDVVGTELVVAVLSLLLGGGGVACGTFSCSKQPAK